MTIVIIPSWYPNPNNSVSGVFIYDQVKALATAYPSVRFFVSAIYPFLLPLEHVSKSLSILNQYRKYPGKMAVSQDSENMWTLLSPVLEWSPRFMMGNFTSWHKTHSQHLSFIQSNFGPVDLIHAHVSFPAGYSAMKLSDAFNIPFILTEHMGPFPFHKPHLIDHRGQLTDHVRLPLTRAKRVIAVSNGLAKTLTGFGLPVPEVISNLVDEHRFYPTFKPAGPDIKFLAFSSITKQKGYDILIQAFALARRENTRIRLIIAGTGPDVPLFIDQAKSSKCDDSITWLGPVDRKDVPSLYNQCDAFILLSRHESFGIVYIEAMACGKPVIATRCGGPESFINKENGILVPLENPEDASFAMLHMANNITRYNPETIRKYAIDHFSGKTIADKIMRLYRDVINNK